MLRKLYDWTLRLAEHRYALLALSIISFIESSVFPVPPDIILMAMVLADRSRAWVAATLCTVASVLGGVAGYGIGYFLFEEIGRPVLALYGYSEEFQAFQSMYNEWGFWIVFGGGFTPIPYKVITIASGVAHLDLTTFVVASLASRGARFFLVAGLLWYFGPPIRRLIDKHLGWMAFAGFALAVGGVVALKVLM